MSDTLWRPSAARLEASGLARFLDFLRREQGVSLADYGALLAWSQEHLEEFWEALWAYFGPPGGGRPRQLVACPEVMLEARWFIGTYLNLAEQLLRPAQARPGAAGGEALVWYAADGQRLALDFPGLLEQVARLSAALRQLGIGEGDRVAAVLGPGPEAVTAMLATIGRGAVWAACPDELGPRALADRLGQLQPRLLLWGRGAADLEELLPRLPDLRAVVSVPPASPPASAGPARVLSWAEALRVGLVVDLPPPAPDFAQLPFDQPAVISFVPDAGAPAAALLHAGGGLLLEQLKVLALHLDVRAGDRLLWPALVGTAAWQLQLGALALGATVVLAPEATSPADLLGLARRERATLLGLTPGRLLALPAAAPDLPALRTVCIPHGPQAAAATRAVAERLGRDAHPALCVLSDDLLSAVALGCPALPVEPGVVQTPGLGLPLAILDLQGRALREQVGELVLERSYPALPVGLWGDGTRQRFSDRYFNAYPGIWRHGLVAVRTRAGGLEFYGRSDGALEFDGVRLGAAEIEGPLEGLPEVRDALVVSQAHAGAERLVLLVQLAEGYKLDAALRARIEARIAAQASARHVPARIAALPDLPRTSSGKKLPVLAQRVLLGRDIRHAAALLNPVVLEALVALRAELE